MATPSATDLRTIQTNVEECRRRYTEGQTNATRDALAKALEALVRTIIHDPRGNPVPIHKELIALYRSLTPRSVYGSRLALTLMNHSLNLYTQKRFADACPPGDEAIEIYKSIRPQSSDVKRNLAQALYNTGLVHMQLESLPIALSYETEAIEAFRSLVPLDPEEHLPDLANALHIQGVLLTKLGRPEQEPMRANKECLGIYQRLYEARPLAAYRHPYSTALFNYANNFRRLGRANEAIALYTQCIPLCQASGLASQQAEALHYRGDMLRSMGKFEESLASCKEAVDLCNVYMRRQKTMPIFSCEIGRAKALAELERYDEMKACVRDLQVMATVMVRKSGEERHRKALGVITWGIALFERADEAKAEKLRNDARNLGYTGSYQNTSSWIKGSLLEL